MFFPDQGILTRPLRKSSKCHVLVMSQHGLLCWVLVKNGEIRNLGEVCLNVLHVLIISLRLSPHCPGTCPVHHRSCCHHKWQPTLSLMVPRLITMQPLGSGVSRYGPTQLFHYWKSVHVWFQLPILAI